MKYYSLGAVALSLTCGSLEAAEPKAALNCNGEMGSILSSSLKVDAAAQHTEAFSSVDSIVMRRGGGVNITITFDKNPERSCFDLDMVLFDELAGTEAASIDFQPSSSVTKGNGIFTQTYTATLPKDLPIGLYHLTGVLGSDDGVGVTLGSADTSKGRLVVVFDPYDPESPTYNPEKPGAYLGAETFSLALDATFSIKFHIDPFAPEAVSDALAALGGLSPDQRRDPAAVSTRLMKHQTNDRVLWGRWDGSYKDGKTPNSWLTGVHDADTQPWQWSSSSDIYKRTGKQRVKYGQCMVFAGLLTSSSRTVGIPSRPVTNVNSAYESVGVSKVGYGPSRYPSLQTTAAAVVLTKDAEGNTQVDRTKSVNAIWNPHVWSESWFARPDLNSTDANSKAGWNAMDGTPQESSNSSTHELIPVDGLKAGNKYDGSFIMGESNAKVVNTIW